MSNVNAQVKVSIPKHRLIDLLYQSSESNSDERKALRLASMGNTEIHYSMQNDVLVLEIGLDQVPEISRTTCRQCSNGFDADASGMGPHWENIGYCSRECYELSLDERGERHDESQDIDD